MACFLRGRAWNRFEPRLLPLIGLVALLAGCQKDDHPPFAAGCTSASNCKPTVGISIGSGGTGTPNPTDGGFSAGTLTGSVLELNDATFLRAVPFMQAATVSADSASGTPVTGNWDGTNPFMLSNVAVEPSNFVVVSPIAAQGDAAQTIQAVETNATDTADLFVVDSTVIDGILTAIAMTRGAAFGQVVLFFRNAGTLEPLAGIRAVMSSSEAPAYSSASGWVFPDDTTVTDSSGLVMFGNVELPTGGNTTQTVTVSRPATATVSAIAPVSFSVKVGEGAVTLATVGVQL
ncbi:MAG TPA: hypothetical protein VHV51_02295 [Polyangiaceae bacterium]|nr:hypothetical protein [Polyangiaceae bacterium]